VVIIVDAWVATLAERMKYIKHSNTQRKNVASSVANAMDAIAKNLTCITTEHTLENST
tara:strand:+ start:279 stop:452 length:174 start_codon:yes stop_codon:yes gene_type:complete